MVAFSLSNCLTCVWLLKMFDIVAIALGFCVIMMFLKYSKGIQ